MEKKYYPVDEILAHLGYKGLTISDIGRHVREKFIHPIIYLNESAFAYEASDEGKDALVVGYCRLSAYWDVGPEIIEVMDLLINSTYISTSAVTINSYIEMKSLVEEPQISSWRYRLEEHFRRIPEKLRNPKPFSNDLKIEYFDTLSPKLKHATIRLVNILITHKDFDLLKDHILKKKNPTRSPKTHSLHELITDMHNKCSDKSAENVWNNLITLCQEGNPILQDIDPWTEPNARIYWKTHRGREDDIGRKTFENIISELNN